MRKKLYMPSPCAVPWEQMTGDDRVRLCAGCQRNVYNFLEMSDDEIRELVRNHTGRLCARSHRQSDGKTFTHASRRQGTYFSRRAARIVVAALASVMGFVTPQPSFAVIHASPPALLQIKATGKITIIDVRDETRAVVRNAQVTIINQKTGQRTMVITNDSGQAQFSGIPSGNYDVQVHAVGYSDFSEPVHLPTKHVVELILPFGSFVGEISIRHQNVFSRFFSKLRHIF